MFRLLCLLPLLCVITFSTGYTEIPPDFAEVAAQGLVDRIADYTAENPGKPGTMDCWLEAEIGEPVLVHSYPAIKPKYYVVPVLGINGEVTSVVGVDAHTGAWLWYSRVAHDQQFFPIGREKAAESAEASLKTALPGKASDFVVVSMPNKVLYWYLRSGKGDAASEVFVNTHKAGKVYTETTKDVSGLTTGEEFNIPLAATESPSEGEVQATFDYPDSYEISGVPYHVQTNSSRCGPAALEMYMDYWGEDIDQVDIANVVNCTGSSHAYDMRRGAHFSSSSTAILDPTLQGYNERSLGYGSQENKWCDPDTSDPDYIDRYNDLKQLVSSDYPVLMLTYYDTPPANGHFRVLKGYIDVMSPASFIVHDPWYSAPYYGPDVYFEQTFLVDNLWTRFGRWAMFCAPWKVTVSCPSEVNINEQFTVNVSVEYLGPHPFEGQYSASSRSATITLPGGFSFPMGETATKLFMGTATSGSSWGTSWQVKAGTSDAVGQIAVEAKGLISGTSYSYTSYSDYIGGKGSKSVRITTTYYVSDSNGNDTYNGLAPVWTGGSNGPKKTIQAGIDAATGFMDRVHVLPATYTGTGNKNLTYNGKTITVEAPYGGVIIDCEDSGRAFLFSSGEMGSSVLDGFTIRNGFSGSNGGGIYIAGSSPSIRNCTIENCRADDGGGISIYNGSASILKCIVKNNLTMEMLHGGGGIHCYTGANAAIRNCIIAGNQSVLGYGGGIYCNGGNASIRNCTVTLNSAGWGDGVSVKNCTPSLQNCILWDNGTEVQLQTGGDPYISYSDIEGGWTGSGANNMDVDPCMLGDLHIQGWSPCVDSGTGGFTVPVDDIDGESRPQYAGYDIGADEFLDTDGDGLSDFSEDNTIGTDKTDPDHDDDGMPDGYEVRYDFDPFDPSDAEENSDGDSNTNVDEWVAGTDPTDPDSYFAVIGVERSGTPLEVTVTWKSVPGKYYAVYYSDDEIGGAMTWTLAEDMVAASGSGETNWTDDGSQTEPDPCDCQQRSYRVEVYPG